MSYALIDPAIQAWAAANSLEMFNTFAGSEARFCYQSSPQGECFQISIDQPENELVKVHVWAIEALDDREVHVEWWVPISELPMTLDKALAVLRGLLHLGGS